MLDSLHEEMAAAMDLLTKDKKQTRQYSSVWVGGWVCVRDHVSMAVSLNENPSSTNHKTMDVLKM